MSRVCQVTGAEVGFGHAVSHSRRRTKRRFDANIQRMRYWVPNFGGHVTPWVSARGIETIDIWGVDAVVAQLVTRGERV